MAIETFQGSISEDPVDLHEDKLTPQRHCGADIQFLGIVRDREQGRPISGLRYSCYQTMAERELERIATVLRDSPPHHALVHHRTGFVAAGEPSLLIRIQATHSAEAFALCQEYLRLIKATLPVWKEPVWS